MGSGIAHVCALGGFAVHLSDIDETRLKHALQSIEKDLARQADKGKISENDGKAALARIATGAGLDGFKDCDLVIEAATEDEEIKKAILKALCPNLKKSALIATNTSSISITRLAAATYRPEKFVGLHFMNPVPVMALVEMIRGAAMKLGAHHPMGPLELADFIGLDTCLAIMNTLRQGFDDPKYQPCPLLAEHVKAGRFGRKSGRGFYNYT